MAPSRSMRVPQPVNLGLGWNTINADQALYQARLVGVSIERSLLNGVLEPCGKHGKQTQGALAPGDLFSN
jgi:hypothetical protein